VSTRAEHTSRLGIVAGAGKFPLMVLEGARAAGCHVTVVGLRGLADPVLMSRADAFYWAGIARIGRCVRVLKRERATDVIFAGSVNKRAMYGRFRLLRFLPDLTGLRIWLVRTPDKRNDTLLNAVADEFESRGMTVRDCVTYCQQDMAVEGVLTRTQPSATRVRDAEFGWRIAKELGRLDIGQSVAVKDADVIAVEAIEGTDGMIERAGDLCPQGGWVMIKVAKPDQDMRFDVPTVGPDTISNLRRAGASMLVIEASRTLIVDSDRMLAAADEAGIAVVGML